MALPTIPDFEVPGLKRYLEDLSRSIETATRVMPVQDRYQPYNGNLAALAGLAGAADKVPYFTGPEAMTMADLTSFGRSLIGDTAISAYVKTLLDDANAAAARATLIAQRAKVVGASVPTTSGTSIDFTGIPAGVTKVTLGLVGVSLSGTAIPQVQIGGGSVETTGYLGSYTLASAATIAVTSTPTSAFRFGNGAAAQTYSGAIDFYLEDAAAFRWICVGNIAYTNGNATTDVRGSKATAAAIDRVRLTTSNGTDTFDAGTANITWEF